MINRLVLLAVTAAVANAAWSAVPANAPGGSTAVCNDGTYWSGSTKRGACSGHHGLQNWYGTAVSDHAPVTVPKVQPPAGQATESPPGSAGTGAPSPGSPAAPATVPNVSAPSGTSGASHPNG